MNERKERRTHQVRGVRCVSELSFFAILTLKPRAAPLVKAVARKSSYISRSLGFSSSESPSLQHRIYRPLILP